MIEIMLLLSLLAGLTYAFTLQVFSGELYPAVFSSIILLVVLGRFYHNKRILVWAFGLLHAGSVIIYNILKFSSFFNHS